MPLSMPRPLTNAPLLLDYLQHFRINPTLEPRRLLGSVIAQFAALPYENLTKILKHAELDSADRSRRLPAEVLHDHFRLGTGGTCFSLTATLLQLVHGLGWRAEPILADRRYGSDTHCALLVWIDELPHLVDPGYLIVDPIPLLPATPKTIATQFNLLLLEPRTGDRWELSTIDRPEAADATAPPVHRAARYRLTYKTQPCDAGEFLRAWNASFDWDMMQYPLLTRVAGDRQIYLHANRLQIRSPSDVQHVQLSHDQLISQVHDYFGIDLRLIQRAIEVLRIR
jgi:arylamine N-acetyltransferase